MIISGTQIQNILKAYGKQPLKNTGDSRMNGVNSLSKAGEIDRMMMSGEAKVFQAAKQAINKAPEIRNEVVEPIKEAIKTGTYSVSDGEIAEKLLGRSIVDHIIE
ncbi:MAG: flagellar biosynthesis anti-sigma factor FlgM [Clostridia bacterium]|nr:flagellar biosynthesis anti-sigma factor FlgM [Clostridia bacterium]